MIYDKLANIGLYKGMNKNLDTAIDFILQNDLNALPLGKNVVDGDNVFVNVMEASAGPLEERNFEVHHNYMDIQIDLAGCERIDTGDMAAAKCGAYSDESDFCVADAPTLAICTIGAGNFIICMPNEPHKPGIATSEDVVLKKAVVKVHI